MLRLLLTSAYARLYVTYTYKKNNPKKPPNNVLVKVYLGYEPIWLLSAALQISLSKAVINLRSLGESFSGAKLSAVVLLLLETWSG